MSEQTSEGFKVFLIGASGSGKTTSIQTLIDSGITPFIIATEPGIRNILGSTDPTQCHWKYLPPAIPGFKSLMTDAKRLHQLSYEALTKASFDKSGYNQYYEFLSSNAEFVCDRDGKSYGSVDSWDTDRCLVWDGLSGLSIMAMDLVVGSKPVKSPGDWNVAMTNLERLLNLACCGTKCHFLLIAHPEREKDEISGGIKVMASTLGQKLAPKLSRFFDEVIYAEHTSKKWIWKTEDYNADLKSRLLGYGSEFPPSFSPIVDAWLGMGNTINPTTTEE